MIGLLFGTGTAAADEGVDAEGKGDAIWLEAVRSTEQQRTEAAVSPAATQASRYVEYRWLSPCARPDYSSTSDVPLNCVEWRSCAAATEMRWRQWARERSGRWTPLQSVCRELPPSESAARPAEVTPALVLEALRRIGLPALRTHTQPEGKTLVNFDTIFYTEATVFRRTITLLGQQVEVEATPARYTWRPGDGTARTSTTPGRPYPAKDITHQYQRAHRTVQATVDVTYTARYRLAGSGWRDIAATLTIAGPPTPLRVAEATPVLSGDHG